MKTVLIIDDEKDLCALLKRALNKEQYTVDCAYSLADAGTKLKECMSSKKVDQVLRERFACLS